MSSLLWLLLGVWLGGAISTALCCVANRTVQRCGWYTAVYLCVYWLPLEIELSFDELRKR